jgi:hypothetical protein
MRVSSTPTDPAVHVSTDALALAANIGHDQGHGRSGTQEVIDGGFSEHRISTESM